MMSPQRSVVMLLCRQDVEPMNIRLKSLQEQALMCTGLVTARMAAKRGTRSVPTEVVEKEEGEGAA